MDSSRSRTFILLAVALVSGAVYLSATDAPFLYDDHRVITENLAIRDLSDLGAVLSFNKFRPVLFLSFALNWHFSQDSVFGYHLLNLLLHGLNVAMLVFIGYLGLDHLRRRHRAGSRAWAWTPAGMGLFFGLHPLQTESVTYISSRSSVLCGTFFLAAVVFFLSFMRDVEPPEENRGLRRWASMAATAVFALLALLTKEDALVLPIIFAMLDFFVVCAGDYGRFKRRLRAYALTLFSLFAVAVTAALYFDRFTLQTKIRPPLIHFATELTVLWTYIRMFLWPSGQNIDHDYPIAESLLAFYPVISLLLIVAILVLALRKSSRAPAVSAGVIWFFVCLAPSSSFIPLEDVISEHRLYLALAGLSAVFSVFIAGIALKLFARRQTLLYLILTGMVAGSFGVLTIKRNELWRSHFAIWLDSVGKSPDKARPHVEYGNALSNRGRLDEALQEFQIALRLDELNYRAYANSASVIAQLARAERDPVKRSQKLEAARKAARSSILIEGENPRALNILGNIYLEQGEFDKAINVYERAASQAGAFPELHCNHGGALARAGRIPEAEQAFYRSLSLDPNFAAAHKGLAIIYLEYKPDIARARHHIQKTLELAPSDEDSARMLEILRQLSQD